MQSQLVTVKSFVFHAVKKALDTDISSCVYKQVHRYKTQVFTHSVEPVVDQMLQVFAHPDLSHQLVLVAVHACQLTHMSEDVLQPISQLNQQKSQFKFYLIRKITI